MDTARQFAMERAVAAAFRLLGVSRISFDILELPQATRSRLRGNRWASQECLLRCLRRDLAERSETNCNDMLQHFRGTNWRARLYLFL